MFGALAARLPVGRRVGLHQPRGTGAGRAQGRCAGQFLHRPADVPGRQRRFPGPVRRGGLPLGGVRHRLRSRAGRDHRRPAHGRIARTRAGRHPPGHVGQRREPAQPDPGRTGQGLRLFAEQTGHGVQPGRGHAGRTGPGLGPRPAEPDPAVDLEWAQGRHVRRWPRDDLSFRPVDRAHLQDPQRARRLHRGLGYGQQQGC